MIYISMQIVNIDGDEFADADYGLVVDDSPGIQDLNAKLDIERGKEKMTSF